MTLCRVPEWWREESLPPLDIPDIGDLRHPSYESAQMIGGFDVLRNALDTVTDGWTCPVRGRVSLQFVVGEEGAVPDARPLETIHEECDEMAVNALNACHFGLQR